MRATYRALCEHGYADLTMRDIAGEFEKSRSLVHYHYDTKDDLMLAFLDRLIGWLPDRLEESDTEDPVERLGEFLDRFVVPADDDRRRGFALALFELRMRAVRDGEFRRKLDRHYARNRRALADIVAEGVETGAFREVDPEATAEWLYATIEGARMYQVVLGGEGATERVVEGVTEQLVAGLLSDRAAASTLRVER